MYLPPDGRHSLMGVGGGRVSLDNLELTGVWHAPDGATYTTVGGAALGWYTSDVACVVTQLSPVPPGWEDPSGLAIVLYDIATAAAMPVAQRGCNTGYAAGGTWAAYLDRSPTGWQGVFDSKGRHWPTAALVAVGPGGEVAINPGRTGVGAEVYLPSDAQTQPAWVLPGIALRDFHLLGGQRAIWRDDSWQIGVVGIPTPQTVGRRCAPLWAGELDGVWWLLEYAYDYALIFLHPFDSLHGYVVRDLVLEGFAHGVAAVPGDGVVLIGWAKGLGEQPGEAEFRVVDCRAPRADLSALVSAPSDIPAVGRKLWVGWFEFKVPPVFPPGNALLTVSDGLLRTRDGFVVAQYVAAEAEGTLDALEAAVRAARAARPSVPVIAYWTPSFHQGRVPDCDWLGIEAYQKLADGSVAGFEARIRGVLDRAEVRATRVALVAQCYTSNATQTAELAPLVPVYAALARDYANVIAILPFSDYGRATGLVDHPDQRPLWEALMAGVTGTPAIEVVPGPPRPKPPDPQPPEPQEPDVPKPPAPSFDQWVKQDYPKVRAAYVKKQGHPPNDEWVAFQSMRYMRYWVAGDEYWPIERMVAEEERGSTRQDDYPFPSPR